MIAILLALARIHAGRLQVAVGILAEPGVRVGGRKCKAVQTIDDLPVRDALASLVEILPVAPILPACVAGLAVAAMAQPAAIPLLFAHRQH